MIREANIVINWIKENLPTIFVSVVVAALIILAVVKLARDRKKGKSSCGGCCCGCSMAEFCPGEEKKDTDGE